MLNARLLPSNKCHYLGTDRAHPVRLLILFLMSFLHLQERYSLLSTLPLRSRYYSYRKDQISTAAAFAKDKEEKEAPVRV